MIEGRHLSWAFAPIAIATALSACASYGGEGRDTYIALVHGEEVTLEEPEAVRFAMADRASVLLPCPAPDVTIQAHAFWATQYWTAEGCGLRTTMALAHRCPPTGEHVCAATIIPISNGDPSAMLDPDMRRQSGEAIGMAYFVNRGAVDLVCPPEYVLLESVAASPVGPLTVAHGCGRTSEYVYQNGAFQRLSEGPH